MNTARAVVVAVLAAVVVSAGSSGAAVPGAPAARPIAATRLSASRLTAQAPDARLAEPSSSSALLADVEARSSIHPTGVVVPSVGIAATVDAVAADPASGGVDVPTAPNTVGWYANGSKPGEPGGAVIVGHVDHDGRTGPFFHLADATPGSEVIVVSSDGTRMRFVVFAVERLTKTSLPADLLAGDGGPARLSLVTCGGRFDPRTRHYTDNVVVVAVPR